MLQTDDYQTTQDLYYALLEWFGSYPQFLDNEFFLAGECAPR